MIGAGIAGASAAYHAARLGAATVLVDRDVAGQATAAGAGIVCPWASRHTDPVWHALADTAAGYYPTLLAELGETDVGYRRVGALRLGGDVYRQVLARATPNAGDIDLLTGAEARALFPPLRGDVPAVHVSGAARVDGGRMRDALRAAAIRLGATVRGGTATLSGDGTVHVDGERVEADSVVVAAGAWTREVLAPLGIRVNVAPQRGQIIHLGLSDADTSGWPVVLPPGSHYLLAFDDHRVVVGATREDGSGFDHRVTAAGLAEVLREALTVAPGLADATVLETRIGFRPAGPDALPLLGAVDGIVIATGLGPTGLTLGPYVGRLAARLALTQDPGVDLTPFDPLRG